MADNRKTFPMAGTDWPVKMVTRHGSKEAFIKWATDKGNEGKTPAKAYPHHSDAKRLEILEEVWSKAQLLSEPAPKPEAKQPVKGQK